MKQQGEEKGRGRRANQDKEAQKAKNIVEQLDMGEEWGVAIYQLQKPSLAQRQYTFFLLTSSKEEKLSVFRLEASNFQSR